MFYGEIQNNKDLGQVKKLLAKAVGKDEADIEYLFSGNQILLKRCPSYEHAKKYADLFEKVGAKVNIEQIDADRTAEANNPYLIRLNKKQLDFIKGVFGNWRTIVVGLVLLIIGGGTGFLVAIQYFGYQKLSIITPITPQHTVDQAQKPELSRPDAVREEKNEDVQPEQVKSIDDVIAQIEKQIRETEAEDQKYAGGLIKALIGSRLAILKQTQAMLQQRAQASLFRISIKYMVDGKAFSPPDDAAVQLGIVERELAELGEKVASAEADAARYSGGLVQAVSLSTVAQLKQTQAMLEQKRLALKFSLPQYIGFKSDTAALSASIPTNDSEDAATPKEKQWRIIEINSKVTESNTVWWRYAWRLTLANNSQKPMVFSATIEFQDADGFVIDQGSESGLVVPPGTEQTFTGYKLVSVPGAMKIQKTLAKVSVR